MNFFDVNSESLHAGVGANAHSDDAQAVAVVVFLQIYFKLVHFVQTLFELIDCGFGYWVEIRIATLVVFRRVGFSNEDVGLKFRLCLL